MTLVRLALKNIKSSLRDYSVFFLTLVIAISVFYAFNAIEGQTAMMGLAGEEGHTVELLQGALTGVSLLVVVVLGFLVVYASRFLMKRRSKEFGLYLILGMGRRKVSTLLLLEWAIVGVGALVVGLPTGIALSQAMSSLVGNLLAAGSADYHFMLSGGALAKTALFFALIYLVVMLSNTRAIGRVKLIELLQADKKSEEVKAKNPILCSVLFLLGSALLGFAYYMVGWNSRKLTGAALTAYIGMGSLATFVIIWSVSGMMLRVVMSAKSLYYKGINRFTFRQISSKINTVVFSMTLICLMLFFTICMLSTAFSLRQGLNVSGDRCPADFELRSQEVLPSRDAPPAFDDIAERYATYGYDLPSHFSGYVHFHSYADPSLASNEPLEGVGRLLHLGDTAPIVRASDYNALMALYGREGLSLGKDEFALVCDYTDNLESYNRALSEKPAITLFGQTLRSKVPSAQDGFIDLSAGSSNTGVYAVPDSIVDESLAQTDFFIGNYRAETDEQRKEIEALCREEFASVEQRMESDAADGTLQASFFLRLSTKSDIVGNAVGMSALYAIIGLYIGMVFLLTSGTILALRGLSDSVDSVGRYNTLRKLGASEESISRSVLTQTGVFFLLPLLLACFHAVFGLRFTMTYASFLGAANAGLGIAVTAAIILLVYGGYFAMTYLGSMRIIRDDRPSS